MLAACLHHARLIGALTGADTQDAATRLPFMSASEESSPSPSEPSDNEQRGGIATQGSKVSSLVLRLA